MTLFKIIFFLAALYTVMSCSASIEPYRCLETSKVKIIGGCNRDGDCAAILENGLYMQRVISPVVGLTVCTKFDKVNFNFRWLWL